MFLSYQFVLTFALSLLFYFSKALAKKKEKKEKKKKTLKTSYTCDIYLGLCIYINIYINLV